MRRTILLVLACALACVPAAWAAKPKTKTTVTIDAVFLASGQTHWSGDLKSAKKACKDGRKVVIYRVRPGADAKVGSTKGFKGLSDDGYYWTHFEMGAAPPGKYYAKVAATKKCRGAQSKTMAGPA
jgi:hypothetical protein